MALTSQAQEEKVSKAVSDSDKKNDKQISVCIVCGKKAEYCMRGLPKNTYCKKCAEAYFKFLNYLDRL